MADVIREDDDNDEIEIVEDINELSDEAYDEQIARDDDDDDVDVLVIPTMHVS